MKKISFKKLFAANIYRIIGFSVATLVIMFILLDTLAKPRVANKIEILIGEGVNNIPQFEKKIHSKINDKNIYKVNVTALIDDSDSFMTYYSNSIKNMDITIVSDKFMEKSLFLNNLVENYCVFDKNLMKEITNKDDLIYYMKDENNYAVEIYDKAKNITPYSGLINYRDGLKYYLLVNKNSVHAGKFNDSKANQIYDVINGIINYEKE